jgi:predicted nucleotidyltransferase
LQPWSVSTIWQTLLQGPLLRLPREIAMTTTMTDDPVLARLRKALDEMYGNRLERVVLFGSRARGDAHAESDYDVAVFLRDMADRGPELHRLADLSTDIIGETGEFVHAMPYPAGAYNERTPLMREIRLEGIDL